MAELEAWLPKSGKPLKAFFNSSGNSYRAGKFKERLPQMSEREQMEALSLDGMLVKRPLLVTEAQVLIGFKEALWEAALS